ncbi:hypothetical protein A2U01_0111255, partial [Trifolium medium]|nr:hypothetical protein [Trifolium medium]
GFLPPARRAGADGALRHDAEQGFEILLSIARRAGRMARR